MKSFLSISILFICCNTFAQNPNWEYLGLQDTLIFDIAIDDSANIYIASQPVAVYKSTDNGYTWLPKNSGVTATSGTSIDFDSIGNAYLTAYGGVFKSTNGGETWFRIAQELSNLQFDLVKVIPNDYIFVSNFDGIHRSTDLGQTWSSTNYNLFGALEVGLNTNGVMFAGNITASNFSIYNSTNLGENWTFSSSLPSIAFLFPNNGDVFAGVGKTDFNPGDIYKSTNDGITWFRTYAFPDEFGIYYQDFVLDHNGDFYLAMSGLFNGVYISTDAGQSWTNYGLNQSVQHLAIDSSGYIYAVTDQNGIYRAPGRTVPVELVSFTAEVNGNSVLLKWITATEINNRGFEIERKYNNNEWVKVSFVQGNGTTSEKINYNYLDENLAEGRYKYRLKQIDYDGSVTYSSESEVVIENLYDFNLEQNYPNPFNPSTIIRFTIPNNTYVTLTVYNSLGEKIKSLLNDYLSEGNYSIEFKYEDLRSSLSTGVYFYHLQTDRYSETKKMVLIK